MDVTLKAHRIGLNCSIFSDFSQLILSQTKNRLKILDLGKYVHIIGFRWIANWSNGRSKLFSGHWSFEPDFFHLVSEVHPYGKTKPWSVLSSRSPCFPKKSCFWFKISLEKKYFFNIWSPLSKKTFMQVLLHNFLANNFKNNTSSL
jgi:hypothetical protein